MFGLSISAGSRIRRSRAFLRAVSFLATACLAVALNTAPASATVSDGSIVSNGGINRTDASGYALTYDDADAGLVAQTERNHPALAATPLSTVLTLAWTPTQALCHQPQDAIGAEGFCWASGDDETGTDWYPQGITTTSGYDAAGTVDGHTLVLVSWHYTDNSQVRVSIADVTNPSSVKYLDALLVLPDPVNGFTAMPGHGDSVTLYGDELYVSNYVAASTSGAAPVGDAGLNVFDLDDFWKVDTSSAVVGLGTDGKYHADGYPYVLPRTGYYTWPADGCSDDSTSQPCFTGASLDTTGATPALVTDAGGGSAPTFGGDDGVIVRWPLDPSTGLLQTGPDGDAHATDAYIDPVPGVQGVSMLQGQFMLSAPCPEFPSGPYCLYHSWLGEPVRLWARVLINGEGISYAPQTGRLWYLNEYYQDRAVLDMPWPVLAPPLTDLTGIGDATGDGVPDLVAIRPDVTLPSGADPGELDLYPGTAGGLGTRRAIGSDWNTIRLLAAAGDLTGDGIPDMYAVDTNGDLKLYPGVAGGGFGPARQVTTGWSIVTAMTGVGDMTGDGLPDMVAIWNDGTLHFYPGVTNGSGSSKQIGTRWNVMRLIAGVGDLTGDGIPDLLAVDTSGVLWLYPGLSGGGLGTRIELSTGWGIVTSMTGVGDLTGDGIPDLVAEWNDGSVHLYPGIHNGLGASTLLDAGWGT